jgi:hypothetical protein
MAEKRSFKEQRGKGRLLPSTNRGGWRRVSAASLDNVVFETLGAQSKKNEVP